MNCPSCGAALAEDQRYCLNCGQRRGEPRVDFRQHLDQQATATKEPAAPSNGAGPPAAVAPLPPPPEKPQRDYAPLAAAGGIAVLGIMLLIGVLIGRGTGSGEESAGAPQVITVGAAESSGNGSAGEQEGVGGDSGSGKAGAKGSKGKAGKQKNVVAGGSADTGDAPVASESQLEALQEKTGEEYAEESAKLPDEIATPGEPPPTDGKTPGGGSGGVTLE